MPRHTRTHATLSHSPEGATYASRNSRNSQLTPASTPVPTPTPVPASTPAPGAAKSNKHKFLCVRQFEEHVEEGLGCAWLAMCACFRYLSHNSVSLTAYINLLSSLASVICKNAAHVLSKSSAGVAHNHKHLWLTHACRQQQQEKEERGVVHPPERTHHFDECNPFLCVSYLRPVIRTCKAAGLGPTVTGSI